MVKKKTPLKVYIGKTLKTIGLACIMSSCFVGCKDADNSVSVPETSEPLYIATYPLPTQEQATEKLLDYFGEEKYIYLLNNQKLARFPCPAENEKIMINFEFAPTPTQQIVFEECVSKLNSIFAEINPNYKFEINYYPTEKDLLNPYSIDVKTTTQLISQDHTNVLGQASVPQEDLSKEIDGSEIYNSTITIDDNTLEYPLQLYSVFNHEFGHILGIGDAYDNPYATADTIMQAYSPNRPYDYTKNDLRCIDALYRSPVNAKKEKEIEEFIENYPQNTKTEITNIINRKVFEITSLQNLKTIKDNKNYLINSLKNNFWGYKQEIIDKVIQKFETMDFNTNFGKEAVKFGEVPLETRDVSKTYHYCQYKVPYHIAGKTYTDYFTNSSAAEGNYTNLNVPIQTTASVCEDANGLIDDLSPYVYVNVDNYVLEIRLFNLKKPDGTILDKKGLYLNAVYQITEKSREEYFSDMFAKTTTTENGPEKEN